MNSRQIALIVFVTLVTLLVVAVMLSYEQVFASSVIYRLDDVQDHFANNGTKAVMDLFEQKKIPLTIGVIASNIGKDPIIVNTSNTGLKSGLFELGLHGLNHTDYTQLTPNAQSVSITKGNTVLKQVFGLHPFLFIPPFNTYNDATLAALRSHDMNIISSTIGTEAHQKTEDSIYNATEPCGTSDAGRTCLNPIHVSASNDFRTITDGNITQQTNKQIIAEMADNTKHYGYSVLVLHPQDFVFVNKTTGHVIKNQVDPKQIAQLSQLVDQTKKLYTATSMGTLTKSMKPGTATFEITAKPKVAILTLDDDWIGQLTYGVPILKQNNFNATFFTTCKGPIAQDPSFMRIDYVNNKQKQSPEITTWNNLKLIKSMGFDIQNHGMTHHSLVNQPASILQREIIDSKICLDSHLGIHSKVFAAAFAAPENNNTVNNYISKAGYEFARIGYGSGEWNSNRFNLPTMSMNQLDKDFNHNTEQIIPEFAKQVQEAELPVLVYHNINNLNATETNWHNSTTTPETFSAEMKWLHDNGYQVHSIADLNWDSQKGEFKLSPNAHERSLF